MFHMEQNMSFVIIALLLKGDSHPRKLAKDLNTSGFFWTNNIKTNELEYLR